MNKSATHLPVMSQEIIEFLNPLPGQCFMDATLGLAGHAAEIIKRIGSQGHFIGLDKDELALEVAKERLKEFKGRIDLIHSDYRDFDVVLKRLGVQALDGMLFDLGVSSFQIDNPQRGFSFLSDGPLDMRMDQSGLITAGKLINTLSEDELANIIFQFGEERLSRRIARAIVQYRIQKKIDTTLELENIIFRSVPNSYRHQKIHPATRTFQAIRIAVNQELESLKVAVGKAVGYLKPGARVAVIAFHSLEDRIVKDKFRELSKEGSIKLIFKKPLRPGEEEVRTNPRARSARLRIAERISCG